MIFSQEKIQNFQNVNVGLPTTNVAIPILENVDVPILENIHSPTPENVDVTIPKNIHSLIPEKNHISQTQFQKVDLDSLDYDPGARKKNGNIMLINMMKFDRLTLKMVHTNLV